jgi:hypothetical protein
MLKPPLMWVKLTQARRNVVSNLLDTLSMSIFQSGDLEVREKSSLLRFRRANHGIKKRHLGSNTVIELFGLRPIKVRPSELKVSPDKVTHRIAAVLG